MPLITTTTPNLVGGVSQQSDSLRFDNQCTEQINANPSVTKGLEKRNPTEFVARLKDKDGNLINPAPGNYKTHTHTINRDTNERYVVSVVQEVNSHGYSDGKPRAQVYVNSIDGTAQTVHWDPDLANLGDGDIDVWKKDSLFGYLSPLKHGEGVAYENNSPDVLINPGDADEPDIKFATIGDVTLLLNSSVAPQETTRVHPLGPPNNLGWERACTVQIRKAMLDREYGVKIRGFIADADGDLVHFEIADLKVQTPSASANASVTLNTYNSDSENTISTTTSAYDDALEEFGCEWIAAAMTNSYYLSSPSSPISDNAFACNSARSLGVSIVAHGDCIYVQPNSDVDWEIFGTIEIEVSGPDSDSIVAYGSTTTKFSNLSDQEIIASVAPEGYANNKGEPDEREDGDEGYVGKRTVKIEGSASSENDDYYVGFERATTYLQDITHTTGQYQTRGSTEQGMLASGGRWKECAGPGTVKGANKDYGMPLILIRQSDGSFMIKAANGKTPSTSVPTADGEEIYDKYNWKDRHAGDTDTNPSPTFLNPAVTTSEGRANKINGMVFHNNRLVFITDENVSMSESGDIWNFFRTSVIALLDADPIDVATTDAKISILRHALGYEDRLLLLGDQTQFLAYGEPIIAPSTIAISPMTSYESSKTCPPVKQGGSVFFPFTRGGFSGVREWFSQDANNLSFGSNDVTAHIPAYIEGNITALSAAAHENILLALSDTKRDTVYVFNYFGTASSKDQFAWSKYTLDTGTIIHDVNFIGETAYFVIERPAVGAVGKTLHIEKINFQPNRVDTGSSYLTRLDRRLDRSECVSATYNATTNTTAIVLPYHTQTGSAMRVTSKSTGETLVATFTAGSTTITVAGDWSSASADATRRTFWVGEEYEMQYNFSKPLFRTATPTGGRAVAVQGRHQLRYGSVVFSNSGGFDIKVTHADGTEYTHQYTGKILGSDSTTLGTMTLESGEFRFPLFSESDSISITASSTSPIPCHLESAEFEANYSTRSRRM